MVTTAHTIHSHYCPQCKKRVEPVVTDALPGPPSATDASAMFIASGNRENGVCFLD
ncbi:hypothetical protein HQ520_15670 [bacterium]|nr:hypothetical protein [bacterium]